MTLANYAVNHAANCKCWAIGTPRKNGFHVRKIVWGLLMAQCERRDGEQVRAATILVEKKYKWRANVAPELVTSGEQPTERRSRVDSKGMGLHSQQTVTD